MIIYINARFLSQPLSGVQRYAIECSLQIKKLYSEVVFLAPPAIILKEYAALLKPQIIGKNAGHLWEQTDLPQFLRKKNNPPLLNLANTAPLSYRNNYITIHDLSFLLYPQWNSRLFSTVYNYLVPRIAKRAKHIFTVSESIKHDIVKHYAIEPECVSITYNGIANAIATHSGDNSANAKKTMILAVGSVNPRKNQYNLIRAFIVSGHFHQYQLVIVGNKGKAFAKTEWDTDKLLSHNVHIKENVTDSQLIALYQEAQIHVSVSYYEGFGIPVLEGLFWGCKTLLSDIPAYRELYEGYAHFCQPANIQSIADALQAVASTCNYPDPQAVNRLLARYSFSHAAQTILEKITENQKN